MQLEVLQGESEWLWNDCEKKRKTFLSSTLFFFSLLFSLLCVKKRLKRQKSFYHCRPLNLNLRWPSLRIANEKQPCTHKMNKNGNTGSTWRTDLFIFSSAKSSFFFFFLDPEPMWLNTPTRPPPSWMCYTFFYCFYCSVPSRSAVYCTFNPPPSFGPLNGLHCLLISYLEPSSTVSVE